MQDAVARLIAVAALPARRSILTSATQHNRGFEGLGLFRRSVLSGDDPGSYVRSAALCLVERGGGSEGIRAKHRCSYAARVGEAFAMAWAGAAKGAPSPPPGPFVQLLAVLSPVPPDIAQPQQQQPRISLMGLRMDDIHAPTVAAGPTSAGYSNGVPKEQLSLQELIAEKDRLEEELKALGQVLDSVRVNALHYAGR